MWSLRYLKYLITHVFEHFSFSILRNEWWICPSRQDYSFLTFSINQLKSKPFTSILLNYNYYSVCSSDAAIHLIFRRRVPSDCRAEEAEGEEDSDAPGLGGHHLHPRLASPQHPQCAAWPGSLQDNLQVIKWKLRFGVRCQLFCASWVCLVPF